MSTYLPGNSDPTEVLGEDPCGPAAWLLLSVAQARGAADPGGRTTIVASSGPGIDYEFLKRNGHEINHELGWDGIKITGSVLIGVARRSDGRALHI
jgi:hypothetical protein